MLRLRFTGLIFFPVTRGAFLAILGTALLNAGGSNVDFGLLLPLGFGVTYFGLIGSLNEGIVSFGFGFGLFMAMIIYLAC
jgi:hypothetical protein